MGSPLIDAFGRRHNNLRISVTDRCNLRCTYCMPEDVTFLDKLELLSFEEIVEFVRVIAPLGIDKVRLTGGEPLMRRDLHVLTRSLLAIPGIQDLGLTTNGLLLAAQARQLYDAGLRRLNVSLDTLDPDRFRLLARRDGLDQVLQGLAVAKEIGFERIKVNAVIIRGTNEVDIVPLAPPPARTDGNCGSSSACRSAPRRGSVTEPCSRTKSSKCSRRKLDRCGPPTDMTRTRPPWISSSRTALGASDSSPVFQDHFVAVAIGCGSRPMVKSGTACLRLMRST